MEIKKRKKKKYKHIINEKYYKKNGDNSIMALIPGSLIMMETEKLSARRIKIYRYLLSLMKNTRADRENYYYTNFKDIKNMFNITRYTDIKKELLLLKDIKLNINLEKIQSYSDLLSQVDFIDNNEIRILFPNNIMSMVLNENGFEGIKFAYFDLQLMVNLQSKYSISIFEKIIETFNPEKPYFEIAKIELPLFRQWMGVPQGKLKTIQHLKDRVLKQAQREIGEKTDFTIDYELLKLNGSRVFNFVKITFEYKRNTINKEAKDEAVKKSIMDRGMLDAMIDDRNNNDYFTN